MSEFERRIWDELEGQLCDVPLALLDFATRQGIVDRLAPRVAAAIEATILACARAEGLHIIDWDDIAIKSMALQGLRGGPAAQEGEQ